MVLSESLFGESKATAPEGHRGYAIGDIHGRLDLLDELLSIIETDIRARPPAKNVLVFLGDLIDRGPDSAQVVERLRHYSPPFAQTVFLMGNHEEILLRVIGGETELLADWLKFGGSECVQSYGVDPAELKAALAGRSLEILKGAIPQSHVDFIRSFADTLTFGSYLFVHAGIRPGLSLSEQTQSDLRWIRQPFLDETSDHGFVVVHGHTIGVQVDERPNRICIDTGAYRTGILTALGIEHADRWFLQTGSAIGSKTE